MSISFPSQRTQRILLILAGLGALILLAACAPPQLPATPVSPASAETPVPTEPTVTPIHATLPPPAIPEKTMTPMRKITLTDTIWQLESYIVDDDILKALSDYPATLTFQDGKFSGNTGCNGLSGAYEVDGDAIRFELGPMTMRACREDVADQEAAYLAGLENAASFRMEGNKLMFFDDQGELLMTFIAQKLLSLTDGSWRLLTFNNGKGGMESNLATENITARFSPEGQISGKAGCNRYWGGYEVDGGKLSIGPVASTEMFCNEPEGVMQTETAYLKNLSRAASFRIEGDRLTIYDQDGAKLLEFKHAPEPGLTDVSWQLASIALAEDANGVTFNADAMSRVKVEFSEDGRVSGNAGCNTFRGSYQVEGDGIEIGQLATTRKMCKPEIMSVENAVLKAMAQVTHFAIEEGRLTLKGEKGDLLEFIPAP